MTVALAAAGPAGASTPVDVSLEAHLERGCPEPDSCTFVASGAIVDAGTVSTELVRATAVNSPVTGTAQYVRTFHGQDGTITIQLQTRLSATDDPWLYAEDGEWTVVDATGTYAGLRGQGQQSGVRDFRQQALDVVYTGQVQLPDEHTG